MNLPRVNIFVHILLFIAAAVAFVVRIRLPSDVGGILLIATAVLFIGNILWLWLSGRLKILQILLFILSVVVFWIGLGVGLQVNTTWGNILVLSAALIFVFNLVWMIRSR